MLSKIKQQDWFLILGNLIALFPFIVLAIFNNPCADDFEYTNRCIHLGFWQTQFIYYTTWQGRYFSTALLSINPLVIGSFLIYKIVPLIVLTFLFHALYKLVAELAGEYYRKIEIAIAALVIMTLYIWEMSSVVQGFYWYSSTMTYQLADILMIYLSVFIIRLHRTQNFGKTILGPLLCGVLVLAIVGLNESSMLMLFSLLFSMLIWDIYRNQKINWMLFFLIIASLIGMYFVVTSPGNSVRMLNEHQTQQTAFFAVKHSFTHSLKMIYYWATKFPVIGITLLFIPLSAKMASKRIEHKEDYNIHPFFSLGVLIALMTAGLLPGHKVYLYGPPPRTINIIDLLIVLGWFINVYVFVEYAIKKYKINFASLPSYAIVIIGFFVFISFLIEESNIRTAYIDLLSGKALRYDQQLKERYKIISRDSSGTVKVSKLSKTPESIYFNDITDDPKDWLNQQYALYFNKKSIVLIKPAVLGKNK